MVWLSNARQIVSRLRFSLLLAAAVLQGCAPVSFVGGGHQVELVAADHGHQVNLKMGDTLVVRLSSNRSTGYNWLLPQGEAVAGGTLRALEEEPRYDRNIDGIYSVGAGGVEIWEFQTLKAGEGTLKLEYRRSFESGVPPLKVVVFPIRVLEP
jgi:predicted secreted protein